MLRWIRKIGFGRYTFKKPQIINKPDIKETKASEIETENRSSSGYSKTTYSSRQSSSSRASSLASSARSEYSRSQSSSDFWTDLSSSVASTSPERSPQNRSRRARSRATRKNVNAENRSGINSILSPTDRSNKLDRSLSQHHERKFLERKRSKNVWNEVFPEGVHVIYTDASYLKRERKSGIGIFMGPGHELNRSQRVRATGFDNNYAEFLAIQIALDNLRSWDGYRGEPVIVRTDSLNCVKSLQGEMNIYPEIEANINNICKEFPRGVEFQHVYAHEGDPGNEFADILAGIATSADENCKVYGGNNRRCRSVSRERNRQRAKSNDPEIVRSHSHFIGPKIQRSWTIL